jgi:hypothetical protein
MVGVVDTPSEPKPVVTEAPATAPVKKARRTRAKGTKAKAASAEAKPAAKKKASRSPRAKKASEATDKA